MAHKYILIDRTQRPGRNGVSFWRLTFYCIDDGTCLDMTVDATYRNFRGSGWDHVVTDPCPWAVYTDLVRTRRVTNEGLTVLSADSRPRVMVGLASQQEALDLMELDLTLNHTATRFHHIFEVIRG
jgi:hypothetical protein